MAHAILSIKVLNSELELPFVAIAAAAVSAAAIATAAAVSAATVTTAAAVSAATIATAAAVSAAAITTAEATATAAFFAGFSFFYNDCTAIEICVVERFDCRARLVVIWHFYETETS